MKRISHINPGYDKVAEGYGRHGDEWCYGVQTDDGQAAIVLTVYTSFMHDEPSSLLRYEPPRGADLSLHVAFECEGDETYSGSHGEICKWLEDKPCACIAWTSASAARDFWIDYADPESFWQEIGFWLALEAKCSEIDARVRQTVMLPTEVINDRKRRDAWLAMDLSTDGFVVTCTVTPDKVSSCTTISDLHRWLKEALKR